MPTNKQPKFLGYLHSFRAFAILNIVAIHAIAFAIYACNNNSLNPKDPISIINEILFHNSTIYFAVISGLLFSVVLKAKGYKRFYGSKLRNVLLPYLFLTLIFSISSSESATILHGNIDLYFIDVLNNFIYGKGQFTFWYIPVLIFLYIVTPLLDNLINLKRWGTILTLVCIIAPLAISRVQLTELRAGNFLSLSTMVYFTGAYVAGMYFGTNPEKWFSWFKKHMLIFIIIAIITSIAAIYIEINNIDKIGSWSLKATLYYIQKLCLSGVFIVLFKNLGEQQPKWMNSIANKAFTIYFLHAFFLYLFYGLFKELATLTSFKTLNVMLVAILFLLTSLTLSLFVSWLFKKIFGKYSRMLVGT